MGWQCAYIRLAAGSADKCRHGRWTGTPCYEIADKDNLVSGGAVLVRKNLYGTSAFGPTVSYPNSTIDNLTKTTIYNKMPQKLRDIMMDTTFTLYTYGSITRKMFIPTYTMVGFGANNGTTEGKALQYYTSDTLRKKQLNGSEYIWWLSSRSPYTLKAWAVFENGSYYNASYGAKVSSSMGVAPAFTIPLETPYNATPNTDGSYNLIL